MARRKVRDEQEAHELLAGAEAAGADLATWARTHGIDGRSLNAWSLNLDRRRHHGSADALRVVELIPKEPAAPPSMLTIRCGPFVVDVSPGVDEHLLARVLSTVSTC